MNFDIGIDLQTCVIGPLALQRGGVLEDVEIAFHTLGTLSPNRDNVVLICHALTGTPDVTAWWGGVVGTGKAIDPNRHFIIVPNLLGSCYGSTGPESINPATGAPYHRDFPEITTRDQARALRSLLDALPIDRVAFAVGGSLGGMVLLELAIEAPDLIDRLVPISAGPSHTAWRLGFSSVIRAAIALAIDAEGPSGAARGLALARQIGMLSYRSREEFNARFARTVNEHGAFEATAYLEHHGTSIVERFSPYAYLTLTRAMELHDVYAGRDGLRSPFATVRAQTLVVGASSDVLYDRDELIALAGAFPRGRYAEINAPNGHDSFLVAADQVNFLIHDTLEESVEGDRQ